MSGELLVTTTVPAEWVVEGVNELLARARKGIGAVRQSWLVRQARLQWSRSGGGLSSPRRGDGCAAGRLRSWDRHGSVGEVRREAQDHRRAPRLEARTAGDSHAPHGPYFSSTTPAWGWREALLWAKLEGKGVKDSNQMVVKISFEAPKRPAADIQTFPSVSSHTLQLLDNPATTDLIIRAEPFPNSPASYILASQGLLKARWPHFHTLMNSGWNESSSWTSTNPRDLDLRADNPFDGDEDEFARFRRLLIDLEEDHEWSDGQGEGKRRFDSVEESVSTASSRSASSAPKRIKRSTSGSVPEDVIPRYFLQITVKRCSYATFHAFLEFLYTGEISFLPSHSDFLVHDCDNGRYISESACEHACEIWLQRRAPRTVPAPCSPQAVYCLADRYLMDDLKKRAKRFLVSSLTVENVAYEAFSSLSVDLKDYQQPVLDFLLKNWDEVKNSRAMQNVRYLLALGDLSDAAPILGKIFDRLSFDKGKDEKVGQEKG